MLARSEPVSRAILSGVSGPRRPKQNRTEKRTNVPEKGQLFLTGLVKISGTTPVL